MANQINVQSCLFKSQFLERINALSLKTLVVNAVGISFLALLMINTLFMSMINPGDLTD